MTIDASTRYGTRWGRTTLLITIGLLAIAGMLTAVRTKLLASSFVIQNGTAQFSTSGLEATDAAFGVIKTTTQNGTTIYPLRGAFANGTLDGLCVSQTQSILGVPYTVMIKAGNGVLGGAPYEITGNNVQLDLTSVKGVNGTNGNGINLDGYVQLGIASYDIVTTKTGTAYDANPLGAPVEPGYFGIQAKQGHLFNLRGNVYDMNIAGSIALPGLNITVNANSTGCNDIPSGSTTPTPLPK